MDYLTPQKINHWRNEPLSSISSIQFILRSALHSLEGKSTKQIIEMAEMIQGMFNSSMEFKHPKVLIPKDPAQLAKYGSDLPLVWISDISDLYSLLGHLDSKKLIDLKGNEYEWHELYAAYALLKIAEYEDELDKLRKFKNEKMSEALLDKCNYISMINIDAAISAHISKYLFSVREFFKAGSNNTERIANNVLKRKATNATDKKYANLRQIKDRFIAYCIAHNSSNKTDAARKFYRGLSADDKKIISPTKSEDKAIRTLTSCLRGYQKGLHK